MLLLAAAFSLFHVIHCGPPDVLLKLRYMNRGGRLMLAGTVPFGDAANDRRLTGCWVLGRWAAVVVGVWQAEAAHRRFARRSVLSGLCGGGLVHHGVVRVRVAHCRWSSLTVHLKRRRETHFKPLTLLYQCCM